MVKGYGEVDPTWPWLIWIRITGIILIGCFMSLLVVAFAQQTGWPWPEFSLAISSVEGVSPTSTSTSNQTSTAISPVFTLSLHAKNSHNFMYPLCFNTEEIWVFYQSVLIVSTPIRGEFCIGMLEEQDVTVHAWSTRELQLPAIIHDQLYEETMQRKAVFIVQLRLTIKPLYQRPYTVRIDCPTAVANAAMTQCHVMSRS